MHTFQNILNLWNIFFGPLMKGGMGWGGRGAAELQVRQGSMRQSEANEVLINSQV